MSKSTAKSIAAPKLVPTIVTEETVSDVALDGIRRRPVVAINEDGELVVCCRRTARKHGWTVEGKLHQRTRSSKKVAIDDNGKLHRRDTDNEATVLVTKTKVTKAKALMDSTLDDILGKQEQRGLRPPTLERTMTKYKAVISFRGVGDARTTYLRAPSAADAKDKLEEEGFVVLSIKEYHRG